MEPLFEGLTESEIQYLQYLKKRNYFDGFEMFVNTDTSSNYRFVKLIENGYITNDGSGEPQGSCKITVTGKGIAAIVDYERYKNKVQSQDAPTEALNRIAESLEKQNNAALYQADFVESIAQSTKVQANTAIQQAISTQAIAESSIAQAKVATEQAESTKAIADASKKQAYSVQIIAQEETKQADITNASKGILYKLYMEYCDKCNHGFFKPTSKYFGSFEDIHANLFPQICPENLSDSLQELKENGFLNNISADNAIQKYELSNYAISTLEALPKEALLSAVKFIAKFIPVPISK